jgi:hypothetical protein
VPAQVCPRGRRLYRPLGVLPPTTAMGLVTRIELVYLEPQSSALPLSYTDRGR